MSTITRVSANPAVVPADTSPDVWRRQMAAIARRSVSDRLDEWAQLNRAWAGLLEVAGEALPYALADGGIAPDAAENTLRWIHAEALYRQFSTEQAWATQLTAAQKDEVRASFATLERLRRTVTARRIRAAHLIRLPREGWVWYFSAPSGDSFPRARATDGRTYPY